MPAFESQPQNIEIGLLKNTGFNAELSVTSLDTKYHHNRERGLSPQDAIAQPLQETIGDIKGYGLEYIVRKAWLPNPLQERSHKGKKRLFNKFSMLPISEGIDRRERNGGVADALAYIEPTLLKAPKKTIMLKYSDAGESMMPDQANPGKTIRYPDAQLYFFIKDENGNYQANTLVMDQLSTEQVQRLYASMGYIHRDWAKPGLSEADRVSKLVRDVMYLPNTNYSPESIVRKIQEIKGSDVVRTLENGEIRTFSGVYQDMRKGNAMLDVDDLYQSQLDAFKTFVENNKENMDNDFTKRRIQHELEKTILNITRILGGDKPLEVGQMRSLRRAFKAQIGRLESAGGCNGGGKRRTIMTPFGPRQIESGPSWAYTKGDCITCPQKDTEVGPCSICKSCEQKLPAAA